MTDSTGQHGVPADEARTLEHADGTTLVSLLAERVSAAPRQPAHLRKRLGLWQETTWSELGADVAQAVAALQSIGVTAGDRVAVIGDARPELTTIVLAAQMLRALCCPIYPATEQHDLESILALVSADILIGETPEDVEKLLAVPVGHHVQAFVLDDRGAELGAARSWMSLLAEVQAVGAGDLRALAATVTKDDVAVLGCTMGTSGTPRVSLVTHENLLAAWTGLAERLPAIGPADRVMADVPLAHPMGRLTGLVIPLVAGCLPFYAEDAARPWAARAEVRPTVHFGTVRPWLALFGQLSVERSYATRVQRAALSMAHALQRSAANRAGWASKGGSWLARAIVLRPLLKKIGADTLRVCVVTGGSLAPAVLAFWREAGVPMRQLYGTAEASGVIALEQPGTAGVYEMMAAANVALGEHGEILVRGPQVCAGYSTGRTGSAAIDADGWLHTGDAGRVSDDGTLRVIDRTDHLLVRRDGTRLWPRELEDVLRESAYISDAVVDEASDGALVAAVEADLERLADWARHEGVASASAADLLTNEKVIQLFTVTELHATNQLLADASRPQLSTIHVLPAGLPAEGLTPGRGFRTAYRRELHQALRNVSRA